MLLGQIQTYATAFYNETFSPQYPDILNSCFTHIEIKRMEYINSKTKKLPLSGLEKVATKMGL